MSVKDQLKARRILFVCHGNICRSPTAEIVFKDMLKKRGLENEFTVSSSATSDCEIHNGIGDLVYPPAAEEMARRGYDCTGKRSKQLTREEYDGFELVIVMDERNVRDLYDLLGGDPEHKVHKLMSYTSRPGDVSDPWFSREFDVAFDDIYEGCAALLDYLTK